MPRQLHQQPTTTGWPRPDSCVTAPKLPSGRLLEHAQAFEPVQDGRIYIEKINRPFIDGGKATPAEYKAGLDPAIARGWLEIHRSGTKFTPAGADLFA
jgi:hypothetical protein